MILRLKKTILFYSVIILIGLLYALFVHFTGVGIPCVFHKITRLKCPGCGVSRMALSLLKGDLAAAFKYNQAILCLLPVMIFTVSRKTYIYVKYGDRKDRLTQILIWIMLIVLLLFGILRNIL